ncbi:DUF3306 domain-containing protein [Thioclava sp. FR2]|uniref:DUF3306 domain-containing protein n=1 Tax=Thioclava sp. FR2 TaxID=3445780 RepID=UPI003EBEC5DF
MTAPLSFWAKRRAAVEAEEAAIAAREAERQVAQEAKLQEEKTDEQILEELGLQDPDLMQMGDDFSAFMQKAVPERLRRRALRKLWLSNPVLANLDGLVDFGEDFTDAATVVPDLKTTYQVGRGLLAHVVALAEQEEARISTLQDEPATAPEADEPEHQFVEEAPPTLASAPQDLSAGDHAPPGETELRPRRHMRFSFET